MKTKKKSEAILNRFVVGPMGTNCYVVADPDTKEACIIDPGGDPAGIKSYLSKNGFKLKFIINTHGHGDHIAANKYFDVPIYIHELDKDSLGDPDKNLSGEFLFPVSSPEASGLLKDADKIALGGLELDIIYTPGHTRGSISVRVGGVVFTGDTLFRDGIGRTDLYGGDESAIYRSIKDKLFTLDDDTVIYPGHGEPSTIGEERELYK